MAANVGFNRGRFIELVAPMLRRKRFTYANMDSLNDLVFSKRKKVDPQFRVPQSHINRFQPIPESSSDSGQSEVDSDTDDNAAAEVTTWIQNILQHVTVIMNALDDTQCKRWVNKFSSCSIVQVYENSVTRCPLQILIELSIISNIETNFIGEEKGEREYRLGFYLHLISCYGGPPGPTANGNTMDVGRS